MLSHVLHLLQISIHAPREGGRLPLCSDFVSVRIFQSTPPARGGDHRPGRRGRRQRIFQSTPPARGATVTRGYITQDEYISIHAPREGGDGRTDSSAMRHWNFNPRPPRGGRRADKQRFVGTGIISIHAPREGGDSISLTTGFSLGRNFNPRPPRGGATTVSGNTSGIQYISIHAPREGGDLTRTRGEPRSLVFQSTPPARGATAKMHSFTCGSLTNK